MSLLGETRLPPLELHEPLQLLQTKQYDYSVILKQGNASAALVTAVRPDFIVELTFHRGALSTWLQAQTVMVPEPVLEALAALAARLHGLMDVVAGAGGGAGAGAGGGTAGPAALVTAGWLRTEWTSALSSRHQRFLRVDNLPQELAMVYTAYAAALRRATYQRLTEAAAAAAAGFTDSYAAAQGVATPVPAQSSSLSGGGGAAEGSSASASALGGGGSASAAASPVQAALTAAVGSLRRAAGVYGYLADVLLPEVAAVVGPAGDRPLELLPPAARTMQQLCLAEGQSLMAVAAATKGMSPGTQRALHAGCATLFRHAQDSVSELAAAAPAGLPPSDRLIRLLAVSAELHAARASLCLALDRQAALELGEAEASCEECSKALEGALKRLDRTDPPAWAESIKAQQAACAQVFAAVHKDRLSVTFQALPKQPPDATANAAVRVAAEAFQPAPVAPPRPPTADPGKGGCSLM